MIVDARTDNFILTPQGVIPIDLQMARFDPESLRQQGVLGGETFTAPPGRAGNKTPGIKD